MIVETSGGNMGILETVEVGPDQETDGVVIWLHGLGADGHDFEPVVHHLAMPQVRFVFPHAPIRPVTINGGMPMRAWFDIISVEEGAPEDEDGIRQSTTLLEALIEREHQRGVPYERIVLAGFSQGGAIAMFTTLRYAHKMAGLMVLSSYLPLADKFAIERNTANLSIPMFLAHGVTDALLPISHGFKCRETLSEWGAELEWHEYPIGHAVCPDEIMHIAIWLRGILVSDYR